MAAMTLVDAAIEMASLVWMELAMFTAAAVVYVVFAGVQKAKPSRTKTPKDIGREAPTTPFITASKLEDPKNDPASLVDSMRKLGRSSQQILSELKTALEGNPDLLPSLLALPSVLLRDDAVELLDGLVALLKVHGHEVDSNVLTGLMSAQLRRRDFAGVASTAARVPAEALTPKMRATLAAAAAQRGRLDEALGHLRQMPVPAEGARSVLAPGTVMHVLSLASKEHRVPETTVELKRVRARFETKQLDDLVGAEGRKRGATAVRELLDAGAALQVMRGPGAYQALANALVQNGDISEASALVEELEAEARRGPAGVAVGEPLSLTLLEVCKSLRDTDLLIRIVELHRSACAGAPGGRVLLAACGALLACDSADAACEFYEKELAPKGLWPDTTLTATLVKAANSTGRSALAERLSEHAASTKSSTAGSNGTGTGGAEASRYATMIKSYARSRDLTGAAGVFDRLKASRAPMSSLIYNCFLDACVQCGDIDKAKAHFEEMKQLNFLDVVGYNTMLKAYLSRGLAEEAHKLIQEMSACGLHANKVTYNELLNAKVITKDVKGVWSLLEEMSRGGVKPNSVTCSILLKLLTVQSNPQEVKRITDLIDEVEEPIDEVLFSSVIEACIRIKQLGLLSDLMRRYRQKGGFVHLTAPTYGSMIKAYGQAADTERVRELWNEMEEHNVKPTSITVGCMVEALVTNGQADEAWELIHQQLQSAERKGCINTVIYSTVLKGFAVARRIDKVFAVYTEMKGKSVACNTITYNTMLDACAKCCAMDRASGLLEDMKEACVEPDIITYSTIVKGYCLEGDVDRAFSMLEEMKSDDKFAPDEIMYNSILDGCAKQHRVDDALKVLEEMKQSGVCPSNYTLSILVKILGHARRLNQAFRMVEDMSSQNGFRPNVQVYTCLVQACILNRRLERALQLHNAMAADGGCTVDEKFYAVLIRGCMQLHQPLKAIEVVRAAYNLPGLSILTGPLSGRGRGPVGVDPRALEEIVSRLQSGGTEEQQALASLGTDLLEHRGVNLEEIQIQAGGSGHGRGSRGGEVRRDQGRRRAAGGRGSR